MPWTKVLIDKKDFEAAEKDWAKASTTRAGFSAQPWGWPVNSAPSA